MKTVLLCITIFVPSFLMAQTAALPAETAQKLCRDWKIVAYESFGVKNSLEEHEMNDHMYFQKDGKIEMSEHGVVTNAAYTVDKTMSNITVIQNNRKRRVYKVVSFNEREMVLNYQDSVLIKRNYYLEAAK